MARVEGGEVRWEHRQPAAGGRWESTAAGQARALTELDPLGADVGTESPYEPGVVAADPVIYDAGSHWGSRAGSPSDPQAGCAVNGLALPCEVFLRMADDGVLNFLTDDPRGGARPYEAPVRRVGAGSTVWVELGTRRMPGRGWRERAVGDDEVISSDITLRRMGFFIHLPVGAAASATADPQNPTPNVDDLRNRIANFLKKPGCADFIKDLINRTATDKNPAEGTNALDLFNKIAGQEGVVYGDTIKKAYGIDGGTAHGRISTNNAQIELGSPPRSAPAGLSRRGLAEYMNDQARLLAQVALHETIHLAGKNGLYSDTALANSVAAMRGVAAPKFANEVAASHYWNAALAKACY